jgi:hypothetical protein
MYRNGSAFRLCMVNDVSATGAKLELADLDEIPNEFTLRLSKYGAVHRQCKVAWRSKTAIGVRFVIPDKMSGPTTL